MNNWIKRVVTTLLVVAQFIAIPTVAANSSTDNQKEKIKNEVEQTQKEIDRKLSEASEITNALDELAKEIENQENTINETQVGIEKQEELVEDRYEHTAEQLKMMQKGEVNQNIIIGLFQSENFSDFVNRLYTVAVLTSANEELLNEAHQEYEKLNEMKEELVVNKQALDEKKEKTAEQKAVLDEKLTDLQSTLVANQRKLDEINAKEAAAKEAAEKERAQTAANKNEQKNTVKVASSKESAADSKQTSSQSKSQSTPTTTNKKGGWMTFQSTGYSTQQAGLSTHTATGINLLKNPRVIAVDPSQIPLNSLVEVEGMGVYVAGDTGGAIKGQIIDVHFSSVAQALNWGRRNVRIRILN